MKAKARILYSTVFFAVAAGLSLMFWLLYAHDLDYGVYINDEYAFSEHFTDGFRLFTAVAPSIALAAFLTWLLAFICRHFFQLHRSPQNARNGRHATDDARNAD